MEIVELSLRQIGINILSEPSTEDLLICGKDLRRAFSLVGFVYIRDHGIHEDLIRKAMEASKKYFNMPTEVKEAFPRDPKIQQGYVSPGREIFDQKEDGTKATHEEREAFEVTRINGENAKFPDSEIPDLRPSLTQLALDTKKLAYRILKALALSMELPVNYFVNCHQGILGPRSISKLRSIYYPPITKAIEEKMALEKSQIVRCGEHSDYGTITFLFQDDMDGLEVRAVDNSWIKATPRKGTVLVNVGDLLEIYSNGLFPATLHRVVIPEEEVLRKKARQSIVFFLHPESDSIVQPLINLENKNTKYEPISAIDHVNKRFAATYQY